MQHVVDQVRRCKRVENVIVAIDDPRIATALEKFHTRCVITSPAHASGTDRVAEVARGLNSEIVVNVQGDEPEIDPAIVDQLIERMENSSDDMATAATVFNEMMDVDNPNLVKVVFGLDGRAIYFSRSVIPFHRNSAESKPSVVATSSNPGSTARQTEKIAPPLPYYLHLGIYAYRREFLLQFAAWSPTPLENAEKLEQLRALEHGRSIFVLQVDRATHGIDTEQQYAEFVKRWKGVARSESMEHGAATNSK